MANQANVTVGVQIDNASYNATQRRILALVRNTPTINLKVSAAPLGRINADLHEFDKSLQAANARVIAFTASTSAIYGLSRAFLDITKTFIDVEARFKGIQVVLNTTTQKFEAFKSSVFDIARNTGKSFGEVAEAATELSRQGLRAEEVQNRLNAAMILSRQSGLDAAESVKALTAATNSFNKQALDQIAIVNKLANVDANFAVSSKDLVESLSRAGSAAQDAGIDFDKLISFTTSLQQTTARGGAVIGNALRSIFTRVERGSTLDSLQQFGVATKDLEGNVLSVDKVLKNLADTYKNLTRAEQAALSEKVAGIQQINQLKALLSDLSRGNSIYAQSLAVAGEETNSAIDRNKALNQTLQANLNAIKVTATQFSSVFGKLVFKPSIERGGGVADFFLGQLKNQDDQSKSAGQKIGEGFLKGVGQALAGPGLIIGASVLFNITKQLAGFAKNIILDYSSLNATTKQQANIQNAINQIIASGNSKYLERLARARSVREEEEAIKRIMLEVNGLQLQRGGQFYGGIKNVVRRGGGIGQDNGFIVPRASGGYLPVAEEAADIHRGVGGASRSARPKVIPNFNFGGGKRGTVVANTDEYIVPNFGGGDGSAIFNQQMVRKHGLPQGARKINAAGGLIPSYAKIKHQKFHGGAHRLETDSGSRLNYFGIEDEDGSFPDYAIDHIKSNKKGDAFKLFNQLAKRAKKGKRGIYSDILTSQSDRLYPGMHQDYSFEEIAEIAYPQLRYRNQKGLNTKLRLNYTSNDDAGQIFDMKDIGKHLKARYKTKQNFVNHASNGVSLHDVHTTVGKDFKGAAGGFVPNYNKSPRNLENLKAAKFRVVGKTFDSTIDYIATRNASVGKPYFEDDGNIQKAFRMTTVIDDDPIGHKTFDSMSEAVRAAKLSAKLKTSGRSKEFYKLEKPKYVSAAGGLIPNFAKLLGSGSYGSFYDLERKYKGVNLGKKIFTPDRDLKTKEEKFRPYQLRNIENEFIASKVLQNFSENGQLPSGVYAPKTFGSLSRALERKSFGKEVIKGIDGHKFAQRLKKQFIGHPEEFNVGDGVDSYVDSISSYLKNTLIDRGVETSDLHEGNYIISPELAYGLERHILSNPARAKALGEGSQSNFEDFFTNFLGKHSQHRVSIIDPGGISSSRVKDPLDFRKIAGLAGGYIPNYVKGGIGYHRTKKDFDKFELSKVDGKNGDVLGRAHYFANSMRDAKEYYNHIPANKIITALLDGEIFTPSQEKIKLGAAKKFVGLFKERHGKDVHKSYLREKFNSFKKGNFSNTGGGDTAIQALLQGGYSGVNDTGMTVMYKDDAINIIDKQNLAGGFIPNYSKVGIENISSKDFSKRELAKIKKLEKGLNSPSISKTFKFGGKNPISFGIFDSLSESTLSKDSSGAAAQFDYRTNTIGLSRETLKDNSVKDLSRIIGHEIAHGFQIDKFYKEKNGRVQGTFEAFGKLPKFNRSQTARVKKEIDENYTTNQRKELGANLYEGLIGREIYKGSRSRAAGGFIPNYADNLLTNIDDATGIEKLIARVFGFNLVNAKSNKHLKSQKLKGRLIDTTGDFSRYADKNDPSTINRALLSRKATKALVTSPRLLNIDKFDETQISKGLAESRLASDLFKKHGITPSQDKNEYAGQLNTVSALEFGDEAKVLFKDKNSLQGKGVFGGTGLYLAPALPKPEDFIIQKEIAPDEGTTSQQQFLKEYRVDIVGGRKGVFGGIPLLKRIGTLSDSNFKGKTNLHVNEKNNFRFLRHPIEAFRAVRQAYKTVNSIDPSKRAGAVFGADAFPEGAIELNPGTISGASGSQSRNFFSSLITGIGLRRASNENVDYFTNRGKDILKLTGKDQSKEFRGFTKELLELQKHDEFGYLKIAQNLNKLGYGLTIGKGKGKEQLGGGRASKLFSSLGLAGGYLPNFANIRGFHGTRFESANSFNGKIDPSISSGEGQGKGFYFYTRPATAISHAANFLKDNPGNPFVISSKFDQSKVVPDYEQNLRLGLEFLYSNPELLSSLTDIPVGPTGRQKLSSIKKNDSGLSLNTALGNYKLKKQYNLDNLNQEYSGSVGDAALIGPIMDKLRELHPDKLIPFEQAFINKAKKSKLPKALRYIGDSIPGKISKVNTKGYNNAALDNAAGGFMPNFCAPGKNPIECAIKREHAAGIPYSQIKIERSAALAAPHNPHGLAITNTRDEPGGIGQGIARALSEGKNPKTYGVPNFATPTPKFTAGEAANYGDNRNVSKSVRANVKDFIGAFDIPKKDLILPIDKLRKSITDSIATALKIDPRLVTAKQAAGFNKIAERIIRVNTQAINDAGLKEAQRQQALVQKQKQAQKDEVILNSYSNRLAQKAALENQKDTGFGGFFKGIGSSKRLQAESDKIIGFAKKAGLSSFELDKLKLQQSNILDSQKDRRRQRIQGAAFTASIGLPVVTNLATSLLPNTNPTGRKVNALGEAAGSGLSVAATLGFSPLGLALGAATTALIGFKGVADASRKSLDELTKETDDVRGNFENNKNSAASIFQGREQLTDLINKGASSQEINLVSSQIQELIGQIDDNGLSRKIINAKKPQDQFDIIAELSAKQVKAVSEKGLGVSLESIIGQKRDITGDFFDDTQNILLKKQERLDVASLVKNALPLNTNEKKRNKQIEGLNNINDSGNFSLDELQKVLGNLNISPEVLKQFQQLASIEQEAIVKNVVQRNLSAEAIKKETESLKQYTQSVINIGRSLDKLQTATNFKFDLNNIKDSGTRVRALSGAGQSLNSLNDFITPETKNRFDNKLKTLENKDQNIKNITDISRGFINSFENLPSVIDDGLKNIQSGDNVKDSISSKSDKLKNDLQQLRAGLLDFGSKNNPVDTANFANSEINKLISSLTGKDPGINGPLIAAIEKFRSEGFTVPIELERAQDSERKALQENTNKINELTLSINKQLSFLGGRGFEELPSANFDKITAGLRQGKEIRESVNGPFSSRIYKSRGNKFDDFFKGQEIDVDAENSRKAKVFSTLASGKLQAYKEGLFNDNPELINQTRFEVAKAQEFRQTEVLQKLIKSAQNNGDVDFADQLRSQLPKVADNAALYAAKEVPFDQKDLTKPFGPEGAFKELSANLANLQKSFEAGVKGDFKSLLNSSSLAAKQLLDLSNITKQLNDLNKNTAKQSQLVDLNSQKKELEEQKRKLESEIIPDQQKKFNKDLNKEFLSDDKFYDRLPRSIADKVGLGAKGIERLSLSDKKGFLAPLTPGGGSELEAFASQLGLNPDDRKAKNAFGFFNKAAKSTKDDPFSSVDLINSLRKNFKDELKSDPDYVKKVISAQVRANSNNYSGISRNSLTDAPDVAGLQIESRLQGLDTALSNPFNDEKISQDELRSLNDRIKELEARQNEISNQATGYLPGFAGGLLKSIGKEQKAINLGVGGAKPGDKPYVANIKGIGPAVVNTGETIVRNFSGGKDAVLNRAMKQKMGFANLADGFLDKVDDIGLRFEQDLSVKLLKSLPEFIKKPLRQGVGRVLTNVIDPLSGNQSYYNVGQDSTIEKGTFSSNIINTVKSIIQDKPAYKSRSGYGDTSGAERSLFREYFDLEPQDKNNIFIKDGKNYSINPETRDYDALRTLQEFKRKDKYSQGYAPIVARYIPGQPDKYDFNLHQSELDEYKGKPLPLAYYGRNLMEAIGNPASVRTGGYANGLIPNYAEGNFDFDYASQIADIKAFTADRAEEMFDKKSRAAFYDRSGKYSDTAAAKNISKAKSFKSLAGSFGVLGRLAGVVALLPSVYDTATTSGSEQAGNALGLGVNIAGIANPVFGTGSAIGGGISSGLLALYRKITGSDYGDGQFTLNPFADIAKGLPDVFGGMLSNYTTPNIQAQMIRSQELKKFNSTGKYGIPNYADGNLDIDINKLPEHLKRYGEGLVVDEDLDNLIKLYKKEGIAGLKNRLDSVDVKSDKLIVNKAGGFLPEINRLQNNNIRSSIDATRNRFNDSRRVSDTKNGFVGSKLDYQAFLISEQSKLPKNSVGVGRNGYINNKDFGNTNNLEAKLAFPKPIVDKVNFSPNRFADSGKHWAGNHVNNPTLDFIDSDKKDLLSDFALKRGRYADDIGKPFNKADYREDDDFFIEIDSFFNPYGAKNNNFDYLKEQNNRFSEGNFPGRDVFTPYGKGAIDTGEGGGISSSFVGPIIPGGGKGVLGAAYNYTRASQSPGGKFDPNGNMIDPIDKAEKLAIYQAELEKKNNRTGKGAFGGLSSQSQLNDFANQKRNNNFGGSKIFDDKFNAETNSFRSQFAGNAGYKGLDIQERIRTQGSAFKSVGLETSGGLRTGSLNGPQRYGASELTPEDNERDARKNYNTRQNRYNQTVGNPDSSDAKIQRKFEELEQKINNNNSNSNNQSNSNSSGPVDVNHSIKIEINGSINSQNAAAQSIIDEELATFKQRTQDRLAALESVNKNAPPVPPKIPTLA